MPNEQLIEDVKRLFTKLGVAVSHSTPVSLSEEEVKLLARTTLGDYLVSVAQDSEYATLH